MKSNHWWNDLENMFSRISKKSQRPKVLKEPILFFFIWKIEVLMKSKSMKNEFQNRELRIA